jgi:hypothetical protein
MTSFGNSVANLRFRAEKALGSLIIDLDSSSLKRTRDGGQEMMIMDQVVQLLKKMNTLSDAWSAWSGQFEFKTV